MIRVKVSKCGDRPHLIMYYDDPVTGQRFQQTTKTNDRREALKAAAAWEAELVGSSVGKIEGELYPVKEIDEVVVPYANEGVVYFVQDKNTGMVKIGKTTDSVKSRMSWVKSASPHRTNLVCLAVLEGGHKNEPLMHQILQEHRSHGEWHFPTKQVMDYVKYARALMHDLYRKCKKRKRRLREEAIERLYRGA